jgi:hypothetical protein
MVTAAESPFLNIVIHLIAHSGGVAERNANEAQARQAAKAKALA